MKKIIKFAGTAVGIAAGIFLVLQGAVLFYYWRNCMRLERIEVVKFGTAPCELTVPVKYIAYDTKIRGEYVPLHARNGVKYNIFCVPGKDGTAQSSVDEFLMDRKKDRRGNSRVLPAEATPEKCSSSGLLRDAKRRDGGFGSAVEKQIVRITLHRPLGGAFGCFMAMYQVTDPEIREKLTDLWKIETGNR